MTQATEELLTELREQYLDARELPDGSIAALGELLFTRAVYVGVDRYGWARRYCFENRHQAMMEYLKLQGEDDVPQGFTAQR
jgi:hypothetical protein